MHIPAPSHDTRRGSSRYRYAEGYAEADAIDDNLERQRALDAVRAAALRNERGDGNVPTAHQIASMLSDAVGLALADPQHAAVMKSLFGPAVKRALAARGFTLGDPETMRLVDTRLQPSVRILEFEARERADREIARVMKRRQSTRDADTMSILKDMCDD